MDNNIQINKNTLLIVSLLIIIAFVSSITTAYLMGVRYGEETILPMQVVTPTSEPQSVPPMQTEPAVPDRMPPDRGDTMPGEGQQGSQMSPEVEVACTMEAKICPDGSSVGRMPPNCEFAPCPGE